MCITIGERAAIVRDSIILLIFIFAILTIGLAINIGIRTDTDCDLPKKCVFILLYDDVYELLIQNDHYCNVQLTKIPTNYTDCYPKVEEDGFCTISFRCYNVSYVWLKICLNIVFIFFPIILIILSCWRLYKRYDNLSYGFSATKNDEEQNTELLSAIEG